jgi:hypothetical protein
MVLLDMKMMFTPHTVYPYVTFYHISKSTELLKENYPLTLFSVTFCIFIEQEDKLFFCVVWLWHKKIMLILYSLKVTSPFTFLKVLN